MNWTSEDERYKNRMMLLMDRDTLSWADKKTKEISKLMSYYRCAMMEIETKFNVLNLEYSIEHDRNPISSIKTRLKEMSSIIDKLNRNNIPISFKALENLHDIAGVRVICSFPEDVEKIAEAFLKQDDIKLIEKKDYIKNPKENGYRSLHLIVEIPIFLSDEKKMMKVEIQLRTIAMDFWASLEHQIRYKKDVEFTDEMKAELTECAKMSAELDLQMDILRQCAEAAKTNEKERLV